MIMENPWSEQTFLRQNFIYQPTFIDNDRTKRGDNYVKPTAYWFVNCENTVGYSFQNKKRGKCITSMKPSRKQGICSEERSMITSDYARNFICDFILGKKQNVMQNTLFD